MKGVKVMKKIENNGVFRKNDINWYVESYEKTSFNH